MEDGTIIVLALIAASVITGLVMLWYHEHKIDRRERISEKRKAAYARPARANGTIQEPTREGELGEWVPKLLEGFGINPMVLLEDEMPEDLKTLLPMAKAFINGGGLKKLFPGGAVPPPAGSDEGSEI